jgi:peptide/nickel transport system substrate-binding protein
MTDNGKSMLLEYLGKNQSKLDRREFIQRALAAGVSAAAANVMLSTGARAAPKRGGNFRLGLGHGSTTDTLDPGTAPDQFTQVGFGGGTLSNALTEVNAKGEIIGDIAESFESSDGAKTWAFKLRKGVTFHNGKPVTPDDVIASISHHRTENSTSAAKSMLAPIKSIKADGTALVVFELEGGNADFPYITSDYKLPIMPANADGTADWRSGIRTGPYVLEKFEPGVRASFTKNANYHWSDRGWFDRVEFLSITDITARTNALATNEVDYMDECDLRTINLLGRNPAIQILETTGFGHYTFPMTVTHKPFDDVNVRLALKYSIDREDIRQKIYAGRGQVGNDDPIAPIVKFGIDPQPKHVYDPTMAKSHLKKAGLDSLSIDLNVSDAAFASCVDAALLWKEHAKACNIDINVVKEPVDAYWDNVWMKKPFTAAYWNGRPSVDWMLSTAYAGGAAWNDTFWNNPKFNELLVTARAETDEARRVAMYAELQQILHDDGGVIVLLFNSYVDAHTKRLAHGEVAGNFPLDGMKITERWWFAA